MQSQSILKPNIPIVLGSASPRRKELLGALIGVGSFCIKVPAIEEKQKPGESHREYIRRNANEKAEAVVLQFESEQEFLAISADTIVVSGSEVLEKPRDEADARRMLSMLSGRKHEVWTAVSVAKGGPSLHGGGAITAKGFDCQTIVEFRPLSSREIDAYIRTGEPFDKAGSYGAQGYAASFVHSIVGSYTNVIGLPLAQLQAFLLKEFRELFENMA